MELREFVQQRFGSKDAKPGALKRVEFVEDETSRNVLRAILAGIGLTFADFTDFCFFVAHGPTAKSGSGVESFQCAIQNRSNKAFISDVGLWAKGHPPFGVIKGELVEFQKGNEQYGDLMKETE